MQTLIPLLLLTLLLAACSIHNPATPAPPSNTISTPNLSLTLNLQSTPRIASLTLAGRQLLDPTAGISTAFLPAGSATPLTLQSIPTLSQQGPATIVSNIHYANAQTSIEETWHFTTQNDTITWTITRTVSSPITLAEISSPRIVLLSDQTFDTALLDNGGSAWFRMLDATPSALGQNIRQATYWKRNDPWCLAVTADSPNNAVASRFARESDNRISQTIYAAPAAPIFKSPANVNLTRFLRRRTDVFAPATLPAGSQTVTITFAAQKSDDLYGRGTLTFANPQTLTTIANTIARVGVIDRNLMGGNNFHTGYICLHEQYIADLGLFIDDPQYFEAYRHTLDYFRDHALQPNGRVKSRFDYNSGDSTRGTFDQYGFYECQWGFLLDSQPDFVINVASLFDINGDLPWLATHKITCEKALDYLLAYDTDADGLVEMKNDSRTQHKSSDWIDIVYASHKNAFVNAELYHALRLWSHCETLLGDAPKAAFYADAAAKLKTRFNQTTDQGGFWNPAKNSYIYWREKDNSLHGANLVTPVNFMAIAYGLCDDPARTAAILEQIETQTAAEKLFFWPLCLTSFESDEVAHNASPMWPFPNYENGDLFLSWGALGVQAYAPTHPDIALKYVKNTISQYEKDGLAFQRYLRASQKGAGDDILSCNALIFTGLYRSILGIQPQYNRLYLNPHITPEILGTSLPYRLRGRTFHIAYTPAGTTVTINNITITSPTDFALWLTDDGTLQLFKHNSETPTFTHPAPAPSATLHITLDATGTPTIQ